LGLGYIFCGGTYHYYLFLKRKTKKNTKRIVCLFVCWIVFVFFLFVEIQKFVTMGNGCTTNQRGTAEEIAANNQINAQLKAEKTVMASQIKLLLLGNQWSCDSLDSY